MPNFNLHARATFSDHIDSYLEKKFLDRLVKELVLAKFGMEKTLPSHLGTTVKWNRWDNPSGSTTALTDGVSPDGITLTSSNVTATLANYGQFASTTDELQLTAINDTMQDMVELLGYAASVSLDSLIRNELDTNGTQNYADDANNSSIANVETGTDKIRSTELRIMLKQMRTNDVRPFEDGLYRGVIHPLMEFDLISETGATDFVLLAANTSNKVQETGEIGQAFGIKLFRSSNIRADATSTNTYGNIFVGKNSFGTVNLESAKTKIIVKPLGSAGTEDPLDQRATVGYKFWYAAKVLETIRVHALWAYST